MSCCCFKKTKDPQNVYVVQELTKEDPVKNHTLEELKLKLENKEIDSDTAMIPESQKATLHSPAQPHLTEDGLIIPRKPGNPILENIERKNLHRELLFNQKIGKNVLNQKSELQRALEKHKDNAAKKELEQHVSLNKHELAKVLADRSKRRQDAVVVEDEDKGLNKEFLQARAKLRTRTESK